MEYRFSRTIGQNIAKQQVSQAIASGKMPHAYLIQGPEGSGHLALALDIAQILLCEQEPRPCGTCASCVRVKDYAHADLHVFHPFPSMSAMETRKDEDYWEKMRAEIAGLVREPYRRLSFEKEAHLSVDIMKQVQQVAQSGRSSGAWRVIIICGAERMHEVAANSVLKMLEDPRPGVLFLLLSGRPSYLLPTIISRCQSLRLGELSEHEVQGYLEERYGKQHAAEDIRFAARFCNRNIAHAMELVEEKEKKKDDDASDIYNLAQTWLDLIRSDDRGGILSYVETVCNKDNRGLVRRIFEIALIMLRDTSILKNQDTAPAGITPQRASAVFAAVERLLADMEGNAMLDVALYNTTRALQKETGT